MDIELRKSNELIEIEKIAQGNEDARKKLLELFVKQTTRQLRQMKSFLEQRNWVDLKKTAHSMKSTFVHVKATTHFELVENIMATAGKKISTTTEQVNKLEMICLQLIGEFTVEYEKEFGKLMD